jgi:hypothetical protein
MKKSDYWYLDYWRNIENQSDLKSIFYVYSYTKPRGIIDWLFDPSYNIQTNVKLKEALKQLLTDGFKVGLHGSFISASNLLRLKKEKLILQDAINEDVKRIRQHWLRYFELITPHFHNSLFQYDSTLGWNDRIGFRSGCASLYRPYDHKNNLPFDYYEIPQIIMDSNIFDYAKDPTEMKNITLELLDSLRSIKKVHVSVSWHQRVASPDYNWYHLYEQIIHEYL